MPIVIRTKKNRPPSTGSIKVNPVTTRIRSLRNGHTRKLGRKITIKALKKRRIVGRVPITGRIIIRRRKPKSKRRR